MSGDTPLADKYWNVRYALRDLRENIAVRLIFRYLKRHDVLYVHDSKGYARAVVLSEKELDQAMKVGYHPSFNHSHIEYFP